MEKLDKLVEELSKLTVLEMSKLKELLENSWGVKAAAAAPVMMAAPAAGAPAAAAEATEFTVILKEAPADKKIGVIKVVREITSLGLKEAKDLVDTTPKNIKENVQKAEAEEIAKKLREAGATVELKGS